MSEHEIRLGDCLDGLRGMPDAGVATILSDPPFESEAHTLQRRTKQDTKGNRKSGDTRRVVEAPLSFPAITEDERTAFAREAARVARRWVIVFCQAEAVATWRDALEEAGLSYRRACVWVKPDAQPQLSGDRPGMGYESIVCAHASGRSRWNSGGKCGVYTFNKNSSEQGEPRLHPTQKPLALMEALVRDFTDPGELICDPFAGSGTTGVACKRLGRRFIGWERDEKFHAAAQKRLDATQQQYELLARGPKPKQGRFVLDPEAA